MRRIPQIALVVLCFVCFEIRADAQPVSTWDLGNGLKGTAEEIASQLNAPVEKAWAHLQELKDKPAADQTNIDKTTSAILAKLKGSSDYKTAAAAFESAKTDLDNARAASDNATALEAGSRFNIARDKMNKMESGALKSSVDLKSLNAALAQDQKQLEDAKAAFQNAVCARSKSILAIKTSSGVKNADVLWKQIDSIAGPPKSVLDDADNQIVAKAKADADAAAAAKHQQELSGGKLLVGMSQDDALTIIKSVASGTYGNGKVDEGEMVTEANGTQRCEWTISTRAPAVGEFDLRETFTVWFDKNGKLKDFTDVKAAPPDRSNYGF